MAHYIDWSTKIYEVCLKYAAPEDIHVYSIDEVFLDATNYLEAFQMTGRELARTIILDILKATGITAAAGMGMNLYLAKIAMDIVSKHVYLDRDGVIAKLNKMTYCRLLWTHRSPDGFLDGWARGYANKLEAHGLYTMGHRPVLQRKANRLPQRGTALQTVGVNAEQLTDKRGSWQPCTIADIKVYKPENKSSVSEQVLQCPYDFQKARLVAREMADAMALDLVDKRLVTDQLVLTVGYESLAGKQQGVDYQGAIATERCGCKIPKHAHGTENLSG